MLIVGLTGGIASGKSLVSDHFAALGVPIIDTDVIARDLVLPGTPALQAIIQHFGAGFLNSDGTLNRTKLREQIFNAPEDKLWLETLLHPLIRQSVQTQLATLDAAYCMVVIPLLAENMASYNFLDKICVVDTDEQTQLERLRQRDHLTAQQGIKMIAAQATRQMRNKIADDILDNTGNLPSLKQAIRALHERYLAASNAQ